MKTKFRSIEELLRIVKDLQSEQRLTTQIVDKTTKALARTLTASGESFKILDISGDKTGPRKQTININFPTVRVPNIKELTNSYDLAESLSEKYKYLSNLENEMSINFSDMSKSPKIQSAKGEISKLKQAIEKDLRRLFTTLNDVAQGHAPKEYLRFVSALADELINNRHLDCDSGKTMTYAAISKVRGDKGVTNELVFAGYIILNNVVSDDGKVAPNLYIVVKWVVNGNVEIFVEHEFIAPSLLQGGTTVDNLRQATKVVTDQLTLEGFSAQIGNLPVDVQLRLPQSGLKPNMFSTRDTLLMVSADADELVFKVKPDYVKDIPTIKLTLFAEVKAMLKNKRNTKIRMEVKGQDIVFTFVGLDNNGGVRPTDLDFLSSKYKLSNAQLRKIANIINGE